MTGEPTIRILDDPAATARAAAETIALRLREAAEERGRADWATTGGSTPVGIYRALASPPLRDLVPWAFVHVWWGDDRFVPRDDPLSNVRPFDRELLPDVPLPPGNIHRDADGRGDRRRRDGRVRGGGVRGESFEPPASSSPHRASRSWTWSSSASAATVTCSRSSLGSPLFDWPDWVSGVPAPTHIEPHVARVSLNPGILGAARVPMLVAHGVGKAAILASVLGPKRDVRRWPAQVARRAGAVWFLDRDAASSLPGVIPLKVRSRDGTSIAVFEINAPMMAATVPTGPADNGDHPPLLLVHGATADHTTWRAVGPLFARSRRVFAMDRRGRGASGDAPRTRSSGNSRTWRQLRRCSAEPAREGPWTSPATRTGVGARSARAC